jgi:hypothetical protein
MNDKLKKYVDEWLRYDPESGKLFWKKSASRGTRQAGREAGTALCNGYHTMKLQGMQYRVHRIIFLIMTGTMPETVDHIDRVRNNNCWKNLREVTQRENCFNRNLDKRNKTGVTGVYFYKKENAYTVTYGKTYLGRSKSLDEAIRIRKLKENE